MENEIKVANDTEPCDCSKCDGKCHGKNDDAAQEAIEHEIHEMIETVDADRGKRLNSIARIQSMLELLQKKANLDKKRAVTVLEDLRDLAVAHERTLQGLMSDMINTIKLVQTSSVQNTRALLGMESLRYALVEKGVISKEDFSQAWTMMVNAMMGTNETKEEEKKD